MFDAGLGLVQTDFVIDATTDDWVKVAVAGNNYAQNFLCVSEVRIGLSHFIAGRGVAANAAVGGVFTIEREGVVGMAGDNFHPDVGSDPYFGVGRYTVVFQKRALLAADIYMKQVSTAYGLVTTNPIALDISTTEESRPSISKSCGQSNGLPANWFVTWQRTYPVAPNDQEVWGRYVGWNGVLSGAAFGIGLTVGEETAPSPCSPIDANGVRYWPMCYEYASLPGQPRDVVGRLCRADGAIQQSFTISNGVPGADDREPEMDADGLRFVATLTTGTAGYPQGVEAVTFAFLPNTNTIRVEERTGLITSGADNYGQTNICAEFSGGSGVTPNYLLCFGEMASNTLRLERFGGYSSGNFFSTRPTQCGTLPITTSGSTAIGQTVTITAANGSMSGTYTGFPAFIPLLIPLGCNCTLGVDPGSFTPNPFVWTIPSDPLLVGSTFSVQGFTITGSQCLGNVDLSDTVDFTIR